MIQTGPIGPVLPGETVLDSRILEGCIDMIRIYIRRTPRRSYLQRPAGQNIQLMDKATRGHGNQLYCLRRKPARPAMAHCTHTRNQILIHRLAAERF